MKKIECNQLHSVLQIRVDRNETMVISSVTFAPVPEDDNTLLQCKGDNPKLQGVSQTDTFALNVVCKCMRLIFLEMRVPRMRIRVESK